MSLRSELSESLRKAEEEVKSRNEFIEAAQKAILSLKKLGKSSEIDKEIDLLLDQINLHQKRIKWMKEIILNLNKEINKLS